MIVPLELDIFIKMIEQSYKVEYVPSPERIKEIFDYSLEQAKATKDEIEWYTKMKEKVLNWL